jgi:type IV secretory pathway VirB3-like protein
MRENINMELFIAVAMIAAFLGVLYFVIWAILSVIGLIIFGVTAPWFVVVTVLMFLIVLFDAYEEKIALYYDMKSKK